MKLKTWVFPESGGIIPGIAGYFPGGYQVVVDEETNTVLSSGPLNAPIQIAVVQDSAKTEDPEDEEINQA